MERAVDPGLNPVYASYDLAQLRAMRAEALSWLAAIDRWIEALTQRNAV